MKLLTSFEISRFEYFTQSKLKELRTNLVVKAGKKVKRTGTLIHEIDMELNEKGGGGKYNGT